MEWEIKVFETAEAVARIEERQKSIEGKLNDRPCQVHDQEIKDCTAFRNQIDIKEYKENTAFRHKWGGVYIALVIILGIVNLIF